MHISYIENILAKLAGHLEEETVESVSHYLHHGEPEMAFEGLFLDVMEVNPTVDLDWRQCEEIGRQLNLHQASVFDFEFWPKFEEFVHQKIH